jgi:hypothetical protein
VLVAEWVEPEAVVRASHAAGSRPCGAVVFLASSHSLRGPFRFLLRLALPGLPLEPWLPGGMPLQVALFLSGL